MGALLYMVLCAAIGGSASNFFHRFIAAIPGFFVSTGNMVISICVGLFKFIFCFFLYAIMALFETVKRFFTTAIIWLRRQIVWKRTVLPCSASGIVWNIAV